MRKCRNIALLALAVIGLAGCGGIHGGITTLIEITPTSATIATDADQNLQVIVVEDNANTVEWSVKEINGGTVTPTGSSPHLTATYTAPSTPGTYHVKAKVTTNTKVKTVQATITVSPTI